jgi:ABC-2 type transport system permease protein
MMLVWDQVVAEAPTAGMGQTEMARYFCATLFARQFTSSWVFWELNHEIRTGALSVQLLRPVGPLPLHLVSNIVVMPFRLLVLIPMSLIIALWRPEVLTWPEPSLFALGLLATALGFFINFTIQAMLGSLAFWIQQSLGLWSVWFGLFALASGYIYPLAVLSPTWERWLRRLPFHSTLGLPAELLAGNVDLSTGLAGVGWQLFWLGLCLLGLRALWSAGLRRHEAVGA